MVEEVVVFSVASMKDDTRPLSEIVKSVEYFDFTASTDCKFDAVVADMHTHLYDRTSPRLLIATSQVGLDIISDFMEYTFGDEYRVGNLSDDYSSDNWYKEYSFLPFGTIFFINKNG